MTVQRASDNPFPSILMVEGDPEALADDAATGQRRLAVGTDHLLYLVDDAGVKTAVGSGSAPAESAVTFTDITTNNASTSKHGYLKKLDNNAAHYMDGTGAWSTPSGGTAGALVFLEAHTASSSASLDFTTFISSTYDYYKVIGTDLAPATNGADFLCRIGTGGGPTYDTGGNYEWGFQTATNAGTGPGAVGGTAGTSAKIMDAVANNAAYGVGSFEMTLHALQSTAHRKMAYYQGIWTTSAPVLRFVSGGFFWVTSGTAVTAVQFFCSSGNIASGTIRIYGIAKS